MLDLTVPKASVAIAGMAARHGKIHICGTTGFTDEETAAIAAAAAKATIVKSGNFSLGVNLLAALVQRAAEALDEDFDIEIVEMHHNRKVDAPSGTALMFGEAAARGRKVDLAAVRDSGRDGQTGARTRGDIGLRLCAAARWSATIR